jgi:hypothetical protein
LGREVKNFDDLHLVEPINNSKKGTKSESGDTKARARQEFLDGGMSGQLGPNLHFVECIGNVDDGCWLKWDRSSRPPR